MLKFGVSAILCLGGVVYSQKELIYQECKGFIVLKAKEILRHELNQEHVINMCSTNLNSVIFKHVLESQSVVNATSRLFSDLLEQERIKALATYLMVKALRQESVRDKLREVVVKRARSFVTEPFTKQQLYQMLFEPQD